MLSELINTYEELKNNIYIIDRGTLDPITIKFSNEHFYHLIGLHKINLDSYFPKGISKDKKYKYMKSHITRFDNAIKKQISGKDSLKLRIMSFSKILEILENNSVLLYDLKHKAKEVISFYNGDWGLFKDFSSLYCLFGLVIDDTKESFLYAPQSWMVNTRRANLISKPPAYMKRIIIVPKALFDGSSNIYETIKQN